MSGDVRSTQCAESRRRSRVARVTRVLGAAAGAAALVSIASLASPKSAREPTHAEPALWRPERTGVWGSRRDFRAPAPLPPVRNDREASTASPPPAEFLDTGTASPDARGHEFEDASLAERIDEAIRTPQQLTPDEAEFLAAEPTFASLPWGTIAAWLRELRYEAAARAFAKSTHRDHDLRVHASSCIDDPRAGGFMLYLERYHSELATPFRETIERRRARAHASVALSALDPANPADRDSLLRTWRSPGDGEVRWQSFSALLRGAPDGVARDLVDELEAMLESAPALDALDVARLCANSVARSERPWIFERMRRSIEARSGLWREYVLGVAARSDPDALEFLLEVEPLCGDALREHLRASIDRMARALEATRTTEAED